ncbi:hypothetical protein SK128_019548, partial [Halocaridina rubra]
MVAGGVQSVEEGTLYATHPSYYPQFYSTLLPPAPPGSYSSSNYSSSTYSSSGQSSDCSWLRQEGVEGVRGSSPSSRARHPRCTCPSPEALRQARKALVARRVRASRDPRCTCPSPSASRDVSPWSGTSPSPPSSPATASPPPRHPRCTCPEPEPTLKLGSNRHVRSTRDLRCTCPSTPTPPPPHKEPECTCPPHLRAQQSQPQKQQPTRHSSKGKLVHAVLLNYPGSTAISTDHGDFVKLSDSPDKISESDVALKIKPKRKAKLKPKEDKNDNDITGTDGGDVGCVSGTEDLHTPPSSPAQRVKNKLCHLKHKVVSGVAALTTARSHKDHDGRTCNCESEVSSASKPKVRPPGVVTRILPPPSPISKEARDEMKDDSSLSTDQEGTFSVEDLPQPILEDVCSPLGSVPPLSPPDHPFTPTIRENLFHHPRTRHIFELGSNANLTSPISTPGRDIHNVSSRGTIESRVLHPNLRQLQKLSISHGQLDEDLASVIRTRSMELYVKDVSDQTSRLSNQHRLGGSVSHVAAMAVAASAQMEHQLARKTLPYSPNRLRAGNGGLQFSTPCLNSGSLTCFSTTQNTLKVGVHSSLDRMSTGNRKHPDYENVAFHNSGDYVMLSKRLLDQWELSYDACLPPEGSLIVTDSTGVATLQGDLPSVSVSESEQISTALPLKNQQLENVALPSCPSTTVPPLAYSPSCFSSVVEETTLSAHLPPPITTHPLSSVVTYTTNAPCSQFLPRPSSSPTPPPSTPPLPSGLGPPDLPLPLPPSASTLAQLQNQHVGGLTTQGKDTVISSFRQSREDLREHLGRLSSPRRDSLKMVKKEDLWMPRSSIQLDSRPFRRRRASDTITNMRRGSSSSTSQLEQTGEWRRRPLHAPLQ